MKPQLNGSAKVVWALAIVISAFLSINYPGNTQELPLSLESNNPTSNPMTSFEYDALGRLWKVVEASTGNGPKITTFSYDAMGNRTTVDTPTVLSFEPSVTVLEGDVMTIRLTRYGDLAGQSSASYATVNSTASAGVDYVATSGTVTFQPGEQEKLITVTTLADQANEPQEVFLVRLSGVSGAVTWLTDAQGLIDNVATP